eukprot:gnl/MRDRNA2_/MRDRNA2_89929_c0_seq1.p1 gnl/MRDRNA2_/MRDRNA2_89929_c0~~gnl/MRDRNA2_/MRDRNA2_89929_c0_seq1.p1  ORF type:complete len:129 (+),score=20.16 gnl/MRDRNA2_/MRDRNA2_89929_c0_seq1:63-449(+)
MSGPNGHQMLEYLPHFRRWNRSVETGNAEFYPDKQPQAACPRGFHSYGQWFAAHQPGAAEPTKPKFQSVASSFWPYGQQITVLTGSDREEDNFRLDGRIIDRSNPHMPKSRSSPALRSAGASTMLMNK